MIKHLFSMVCVWACVLCGEYGIICRIGICHEQEQERRSAAALPEALPAYLKRSKTADSSGATAQWARGRGTASTSSWTISRCSISSSFAMQRLTRTSGSPPHCRTCGRHGKAFRSSGFAFSMSGRFARHSEYRECMWRRMRGAMPLTRSVLSVRR